MGIDALVVLAALFASFLAVHREWLSADLALMAGLSAVAVVGVVEPSEILQGFASTVVVAVASVYVVLAGLWRVGAVQALVPSEGEERFEHLAETVGFGEPELPTVDEEGDTDGPGLLQCAVAYAAPLVLVAFPVAGIARFETAALVGAVGIVVSGVLSAEAARRAIDWEIVVVVGAVVGFSQALVSTGVAEALAASARQLDALSVSPLALTVAATSALVLSALTNRRAAASLLPLALSTGLFFAAGGIL